MQPDNDNSIPETIDILARRAASKAMAVIEQEVAKHSASLGVDERTAMLTRHKAAMYALWNFTALDFEPTSGLRFAITGLKVIGKAGGANVKI